MNDYGEALDLFDTDRWRPDDCTRAFWYRKWGGFYYSENDEHYRNPDNWDGGGYSSERVRQYVERGKWVIVTLDDDCGGQFQAIFSLDKELKDE